MPGHAKGDGMNGCLQMLTQTKIPREVNDDNNECVHKVVGLTIVSGVIGAMANTGDLLIEECEETNTLPKPKLAVCHRGLTLD